MAPEPRTGPVLAVFAHPDDAEICAGGTLAKWAATGREVHLLVLTNGDRGSSDPWCDRAELAAIDDAAPHLLAQLLTECIRIGRAQRMGSMLCLPLTFRWV